MFEGITSAPFSILINPVSVRQNKTHAHLYSTGPTHRTWDSVCAMGWNAPVAIRDIFSCSKVQPNSGAHPANYSMDTALFFTGSKRRNLKVATYSQVGPRLRMSGIIHLLYLYAFMTWTWKTLPYYFPTYAARNCLFLADTQNYCSRKF